MRYHTYLTHLEARGCLPLPMRTAGSTGTIFKGWHNGQPSNGWQRQFPSVPQGCPLPPLWPMRQPLPSELHLESESVDNDDIFQYVHNFSMKIMNTSVNTSMKIIDICNLTTLVTYDNFSGLSMASSLAKGENPWAQHSLESRVSFQPKLRDAASGKTAC